MGKIEYLEPKFVDLIPSTLEGGVLYISRKYKTASHLCCSGCGNRVVTPLKPGGWSLSLKKGTVSLYPSIGNWSLPCRSHYWIRRNRVIWARQWSQEEIDAGRTDDRLARELHFDSPSRESIWKRIFSRFF